MKDRMRWTLTCALTASRLSTVEDRFTDNVMAVGYKATNSQMETLTVVAVATAASTGVKTEENKGVSLAEQPEKMGK